MPPIEPEYREIDKEKNIMGYKIKFKTKFDEEEGNYITLKVEVSEDIRQVLKKTSIPTTLDFTALISSSDGSQRFTGVRYRIKNIINHLLNEDGKMLYAKDMVDNGEFSINVNDVDRVLQMIEQFKYSLRKILETTLGILNLSQEVSFNVREG